MGAFHIAVIVILSSTPFTSGSSRAQRETSQHLSKLSEPQTGEISHSTSFRSKMTIYDIQFISTVGRYLLFFPRATI